jgi:hypothetical protein
MTRSVPHEGRRGRTAGGAVLGVDRTRRRGHSGGSLHAEPRTVRVWVVRGRAVSLPEIPVIPAMFGWEGGKERKGGARERVTPAHASSPTPHRGLPRSGRVRMLSLMARCRLRHRHLEAVGWVARAAASDAAAGVLQSESSCSCCRPLSTVGGLNESSLECRTRKA